MIDAIGNTVIPIEDTDPDIGELIKDVCSKRYDRFNVKRIIIEQDDVFLVPYKIITIGRNDPCSCGSGKKYKKCCLNITGA